MSKIKKKFAGSHQLQPPEQRLVTKMTMTIATTTMVVGKWMNPFPMSLDSCTITCRSQQATVKRSGINSKVLSNLVLSKEGAVITARKPT